MFYVLGLGFNCKIYKKNPNIRIFINNLFIDDFEINSFEEEQDKTILPNLHFYELNLSSSILEHHIRLEINNSDSNYNNSFMTHSTLLQLHTFYLVPLNNYRELYNKIKDNIKNKTDNNKNLTLNIDFFDLLPYTNWVNEKNITIKNLLNFNIGGSGVFTCNLFRQGQVLKPVSHPNYKENIDKYKRGQVL